MQTAIPPFVFLIFVGATALGVLIQAGILVGMFLALKKTQGKVEALIDDARVHVMPIVAASRSVVEDLTPKIKEASTNIGETIKLVRSEAENIKAAVDDVVGRSREQAARVDGMVTGTLNGVEHATTTIQHGVGLPLRKINGWLAGFRAGMEVLKKKRSTKLAVVEPEAFQSNGYDAGVYTTPTAAAGPS